MIYNYLVSIQSSTAEKKIKHAITQQNINWIRNSGDCRIEYLGKDIKFSNSSSCISSLFDEVNDIDKNISNKSLYHIIITGISKQITNVTESKDILPDFVYLLNKSISSMLFTEIDIDKVKECYREIEGKVDEDWFSIRGESEVEEKFQEYIGLIKELYYDYNLESLLSSNLREKYDKYNKTFKNITQEDQDIMDKIDSKLKLLDSINETPPKRICEDEIIYGKYHSSLINKETTIPPYSIKSKSLHTSIVDFSFSGCDSLKSIDIMDDISDFGEFVFRNCVNLESIRFNPHMKTVPKNIFVNCTSLKDVDLPASTEIIGYHSFNNCINLSDSTLIEKTNLIKIEIGAFANCINLKKLKLPDTLIEIQDYAFNNSGLEEIIISEKVESIGFGTFEECVNLRNVILSSKIKEISNYCFSNCENLEMITIKEGIEKIAASAFSGCENLKELRLPKGLKYIEENAFDNCLSLKKLLIPESVIEIEESNIFWDIDIFCKENSIAHKKALEEEWNFKLI